MHKSGLGVFEAALLVKVTQVGLEVNMQPCNIAILSHRHSMPDKLPTNATSSHAGVNSGVQDEGMDAAIPREIDETNQTFPTIRTDER